MLNFSFQEQPPIMQVERELAAMGNDIRSFKEPLERVVRRVMIPSFHKNFDAQGRPQSWTPLSAERVRQRGSSSPILQYTGRMRRHTTALARWSIRGQQGRAVYTGFGPTPYAAFHQTGTIYMPARPFIMIQPEDREAAEKIFAEWVQERVARFARRMGR